MSTPTPHIQQGTPPPADLWTRNPVHNAQEDATAATEKDTRDTGTALEVLKLAVQAMSASATAQTSPPSPTSDALAAYAEVLWQWVTTDTWPPPAAPKPPG